MRLRACMHVCVCVYHINVCSHTHMHACIPVELLLLPVFVGLPAANEIRVRMSLRVTARVVEYLVRISHGFSWRNSPSSKESRLRNVGFVYLFRCHVQRNSVDSIGGGDGVIHYAFWHERVEGKQNIFIVWN